MADTPAPRYLVTARKYRPQTFGDLVAQEHVAQTLRNAITSGRLAHAYLFSGPRGVGKTTAARILAKAVNCQTALGERPDAEPCRTCDSCLAFEAGRSLNVIEIDAASNNRVEDIRELRDTVRVPPQGADKKVYILDEVHMLSASAFNALLKTLEEPPPYALFIFATTEPHKVLPTILSRTQRFDFRRIAVPEIVGRLRAICAAEGVEADDESLVLLARKGDGALRDALSLFDQALSLCGDSVQIGPLREALGVVDADLYFAATDRARAGDRAGLLDLVEHVVQSGHDLNEFVLGLADHVRNLLVARATGSGALIEGTEATRDRYLRAAGPYAEADLLHLLLLADEAAADLRESRQPRLTLELALLKMASLESALDLGRLIDRIDGLEAAARDGALSAPAAPPAQPAATPQPGAGRPDTPTAQAAPSPAAPAATPTAPPRGAPIASPAAAPPAAQTSEPASSYAPRPPAAPPLGGSGAAPEPSRDAAPPAEDRSSHAAPPWAGEEPPPPSDRDDPAGRGGGVPSPPRPPEPAPPASAPPARPAPARPGGALFGRPALRRPSATGRRAGRPRSPSPARRRGRALLGAGRRRPSTSARTSGASRTPGPASSRPSVPRSASASGPSSRAGARSGSGAGPSRSGSTTPSRATSPTTTPTRSRPSWRASWAGRPRPSATSSRRRGPSKPGRRPTRSTRSSTCARSTRSSAPCSSGSAPRSSGSSGFRVMRLAAPAFGSGSRVCRPAPPRSIVNPEPSNPEP